MFEMFTMVYEIHDNVDLVLDVKSFVELEAELNMKELKCNKAQDGCIRAGNKCFVIVYSTLIVAIYRLI